MVRLALTRTFIGRLSPVVGDFPVLLVSPLSKGRIKA